MSLNTATPVAPRLAPSVRFQARFDQSRPFSEEAASFANMNHSNNKSKSIVPLTNMLSGAPLDSLLRVRVPVKTEEEGGTIPLDANGQVQTKPLIDVDTLMAWINQDHFAPARDCTAYVSKRLNPLIALAAGIAHGADFGRAGWTRLDLNALKEEFPRVVEAISSRMPKKIKALNSYEAGMAGLTPIINFLADNVDKYYVSDNQAVLANAE